MSTNCEQASILITGAAAGIGAAAAKHFIQLGYCVTLCDIHPTEDEHLASLLRRHAQRCRFVLADVSSQREVKELVASAISDFGKLDFAFNNAGIEGGRCTTEQIELQQWEHIMAVNLGGVWMCMKYELQQMLSQHRGVIVNNASVAGVRGFANAAAYVASKHGVVGLTRAAALEHAQAGIRINAVCPGIVRTPMVERVIGGDAQRENAYRSMEPIGRLGEPQEIVQAVHWLFSDEASFVTGHALVVDGGMCAG